MSQLVEQIGKSKGLLAAVEAMTNRRAFITLFFTFAISTLFFMLFSYLTVTMVMKGNDGLAKVLGFLGFLMVTFIFLTGTSATGFLINDSVRGREQRTIVNCLILAVATLPRMIGVLVMLLVFGLLLALLIALALAVCKIPGLGPLLYVVVFPVSAIVVGAAFYAMLYVIGLHGPSIWEGNPAIRTVAILGTIVRERLLSVVIQTIMLALLVLLVAAIIFSAVGVGTGFTSLLSLAILSDGMNPQAIMGMLMGGMGGDGASYAQAGAFGMALLLGCAVVAPTLVALAGNCIIFQNVTENLSVAAVEQSIQDALDKAREKAEQAKRQLEESRNQITTPPPIPATKSAARACSQCQATAGAEDAFCGHCGNRLA